MIELAQVQRQDELMHYGRLGMKWGQHIFTKAKESASNYLERHKSVKKMTDTELQARLNRARNEDQYKALMRKNDPTIAQRIASGAKFAGKIIGGTAKAIGNMTLTKILKEGAMTIGRTGFQKIANNMFSESDDGGYTDKKTGKTLKEIQNRNKFDAAKELYDKNRAKEAEENAKAAKAEALRKGEQAKIDYINWKAKQYEQQRKRR